MGSIAVSGLAYAHPGGDLLFDSVDFTISPGDHVGLVGDNGAGKTTLLRIVAGELEADDGSVSLGGRMLFMPQDVGVRDGRQTVREMLLTLAPARLRSAGERMLAAERALAQGDPDAGVALGAAIGDWSDLGGYQLEAAWDASIRRVVRASLAEVGDRDASQVSGGERKQIVLDYLLTADAPIVLLDEPDNFLDVPAKLELEQRIRASDKTILLISHDRDLLASAVGKLVTLEAGGTWTHGGSYATYRAAREHRQELMGDELRRWRDEERRLYRYYREMKQRAAQNDKNAPKADAAESRWKRFVKLGPPPAPVPDQQIRVRLRGGDSARRVVVLAELAIDGLIHPFSDEIHLGERIGVIGPNGSGKTHLLRLIAGEPIAHGGTVTLGSRVSSGLFTQLNMRADFAGATLLEIVAARVRGEEAAMRALARYGLQGAARRGYETLSGGQRARLEILCLELEGHNLLLLDEPTDNLDITSCEALEQALEQFEGTIVAVSHDRAFLRALDRHLMLLHDGRVLELADYEAALAALRAPAAADGVRTARPLSAEAVRR